MAIIDSQNVFVDGAVHTNGVSHVVALTSLRLPGRMTALPLRVSVTQAYAPDEVDTLGIALQEADRVDALEEAWADVLGATYTVAADKLTAGARLPWRFLPESVCKSCLRLRFTVTPHLGATLTQGTLFAALMREEDFPYVAALQVK